MQTFDTLKYTKGAEMIGIKREHAEYQAEQIAQLIDDKLATKKDLFDTETRIKTEMKEFIVRTAIWIIGSIYALQLISNGLSHIMPYFFK